MPPPASSDLVLPAPITQAVTRSDTGSGFTCEHEALNRFFRESARQNQERDISRTWVLRRTASDDPALPLVLGYYTLSLTTLKRETLPPDLGKRLPHYPLPAVLIARLARDSRVRGRGHGEDLLGDAHLRALTINAQSGAVAVIVDAKDAHARDFYKRFGYEPLLAESEPPTSPWPLRLFLPMAEIRAAYSEAS
ncbi:GNAT family N-acetyltransferase [Myxococcus sp. CA051A]|uniref:GNAT family N-acetyltransferase n=1 Tax=unclassified Myxococcus TaxID=2648731 RepID=UPI00157A32C9|nr:MULTISPECIES: GNAT family N-acetyltransferase [unclassified Myxococcus]NTX50208.1 GNAT family N-acetyltransferase [Myxococcus sp. CA039A]NTX63154.1 GNAT family N-acetyltransferase [Myxococcus sp. CA051A]